MLNIDIKQVGLGGSLASCLCWGAKQKKEISYDPNKWQTFDGVQSWPGAFATEVFHANMIKREKKGTRRMKEGTTPTKKKKKHMMHGSK